MLIYRASKFEFSIQHSLLSFTSLVEVKVLQSSGDGEKEQIERAKWVCAIKHPTAPAEYQLRER